MSSSRRTRQSIVEDRRREDAAAMHFWAKQTDAVLDSKEESIRNAINTVSLSTVFRSPMSLAETERQKIARRQQDSAIRFLQQTSQHQHQQQQKQLRRPSSSSNSAVVACGAAAGGEHHLAAAVPDNMKVSNLAVKPSPRKQHQPERPLTAPIARPNANKIPEAYFTPDNEVLGSGRGGGGNLSSAAVTHVSRFATVSAKSSATALGGGSGANGVSRPVSTLDSDAYPMYSSFSKDHVYRGGVITIQQLMEQQRLLRQSLLSQPHEAGQWAARAASSSQTGKQKVSSASSRPPPSAGQTRQEAFAELTLLDETCHGTDDERRWLFFASVNNQATPAVAAGGGVRPPTTATSSSASPRLSSSPRGRLAASTQQMRSDSSMYFCQDGFLRDVVPTPPPPSLHRHAVDVVTGEGVYVNGTTSPSSTCRRVDAYQPLRAMAAAAAGVTNNINGKRRQSVSHITTDKEQHQGSDDDALDPSSLSTVSDGNLHQSTDDLHATRSTWSSPFFQQSATATANEEGSALFTPQMPSPPKQHRKASFIDRMAGVDAHEDKKEPSKPTGVIIDQKASNLVITSLDAALHRVGF